MGRRVWLFSVLLIASSCSSQDEPSQTVPSPTTRSRPTATATTTPQPPERSGGLEDGKHVAYITEVDENDRTLSVDVIQFLTGDAADQAYREDGWAEGDDDTPPNDYYIRNVNPLVRRLPVADHVEVGLVWLKVQDPQIEPASWEDMDGYVANRPSPGTPYDITVRAGTVVKILEIYVP